jgi:hypothetical protein
MNLKRGNLQAFPFVNLISGEGVTLSEFFRRIITDSAMNIMVPVESKTPSLHGEL